MLVVVLRVVETFTEIRILDRIGLVDFFIVGETSKEAEEEEMEEMEVEEGVEKRERKVGLDKDFLGLTGNSVPPSFTSLLSCSTPPTFFVVVVVVGGGGESINLTLEFISLRSSILRNEFLPVREERGS